MAGLEENGYEVTAAASAGQAPRFLQAGIAVDALRTDVRMPEANSGRWRGLTASVGLPVTYVTGPAELMQPPLEESLSRNPPSCLR